MLFKIRLLGLLSIIIIMSACSGRDNHAHPKSITNKQLFEIHCSGCHSTSGGGSVWLSVPANNESTRLNFQIRNKIRKGSGSNSKMPIFYKMSKLEANKIIAYLRVLGEKKE